MERPGIAVELLRQWRDLVPPGRFLIEDKAEGSSAPPLWKDVGDKEARSRISKALKRTSSSSTEDNSSTTIKPHQQSPDGASQAPSLRCQVSGGGAVPISPANLSSDYVESDAPLPRSVPAALPQHILPPNPKQKLSPSELPLRILPPNKLSSRRISAQLQAANAQGKIYGRWEERQRLLKILKESTTNDNSFKRDLRECAYTNGSHTIDFCRIQGAQGAGKTTVARTFQNPLASTEDDTADVDIKPSFFLEAKFEQLMDPNPYKAFADLFHDFCQQILHRYDKSHLVEPFRKAVLEAFGDDVDVLLKLVPELQPVLHPGEARKSTSGGSSASDDKSCPFEGTSTLLVAHKVKPLSVLLLQTMASLVPGEAMVLLLNDLHWASEASMDILTALMSDVVVPDQTGLIFAVTVNTGQEAKPHYEEATRKIKARETIRVHDVTLLNLKESDLCDFLAETLGSSTEKTQGLGSVMYQVSKGNPMLFTEFVKKMQDLGMLHPDEVTGEWTCDMQQVQERFKHFGSFSGMARIKYSMLPDDVRGTVRYIVGLGASNIDESILSLLNPDSSAHLESGVELGMFRYRGGGYQFRLDGFRNEVYNLLSPSERAALHLEIAQKLWKHLDDRKDKEFLFIILNQLMRGDSTLKQDEDRRMVASLCLRAGTTSAKSLGFQTAWVYLEHGISILPKDKLWGRDNYDLSLQLHNAAIEVSYANGQYEKLNELIDEVLDHSRIFEDSFVARSTQIYALGSRYQIREAIESALDTLKELGETLPQLPSKGQVALSFQRTKKMLFGVSNESILQMEPIKDRKKLAAMQIMNHVFIYCFISVPNLAAMVATRMVQITMSCGMCAISSVAFAFYSQFLVCGPSVEDGLRYGKLSMQLYEKFKNEAWLCRVWSTYHGSVAICKEPERTSLEPLRYAYNMGLRTGDIEFAMLSGLQYCFNSIDVLTLPQLKAELRKLSTDIELTGRTMALAQVQPLWTFVMSFMEGPEEGRSAEFLNLEGMLSGRFQLDRLLKEGEALWDQFMGMIVAYNFGNFEKAAEMAKGVDKLYKWGGQHSIACAYCLFFECMTLLASPKRDCIHRWWVVSYVKKRLKLLENWAYMAPENILDKQHLLMAELAAFQNKSKKACLHYRAAIFDSKAQRRVGVEALGNERFARFYIERGEVDSALPLLDETCRLYEEWGAKGKVRQLKRYRQSIEKGLK